MRAVLSSLVLALAGCATATSDVATTAPLVEIGADFQLAVGAAVNVAKSPLTVKFERVVEDSRCPMNARCVWEGNARVAVHVDETSPVVQDVVHVVGITLELNTSQRFPVRRQSGNYDIVLVNLEPTPMTGETVTNYVVTLRVEPRP